MINSKPNIKLREARKAKRLTQQQLADKIGVWHVDVSRWETGKVKPCLDNCRAIAKALGTTIGELFG